MLIENISNDRQLKLYMAIEKNLSSLRKRSIAYTITSYSEKMGTVNLMVTGKKGTASKIFIVSYDSSISSWVIYAEDKTYTLVSLMELSTIAKSMVAKLSTTLNKI